MFDVFTADKLRLTRWCIAFVFIVLGYSQAHSQSVERWSTNYYSVTGATLVEIRQSLQQNRPWKEKSSVDASTRWQVHWRYNVFTASDRCRVQSFSTETIITMPRWIAPTNTSQNLRDMWISYIKALGGHEEGHGQIAIAAAAEMRKRVNALPAEPSCDSLKARIEETCRRSVDDYKDRDKDYDERTDHGATQGARLRGSREHRSGR
jgi:predicted secreted Zn-dependent protease